MAGGDCTNGGVAEELRTCPLSEARGSIPSTARHVSLRRGDAAAIETFSFAEVSSESGTNRSPLVLAYGGREYPLGGRWQNLPIVLCRLLDVQRPNLLERLVAKKVIRNLSLDGTELRRGQLIEGLGVWFEKNLSARDFIHQARKLLDAFDEDPAHVVLKVVRRGAVAARARVAAERTEAAVEGNASPSSGQVATQLAQGDALPTGERIGAYAKREIYAALAEGRVPDDDFARLQTLEGTKEILGGALSGCPLFSCKEKLPTFGHKKFWHAPVHRNGISVYVNSQWFEYHRPRLEKLLSRWRKADATAAPLAMSAVTDAQRTNLGELLEAKFTNGFRLGSYIDGKNMRDFYQDEFGEGLPEDLDLASVLPQIGIPLVGVDGKVKVYPWPSNKDGGWRKIVDDLVARGNDVFQFSCLMNRHGNEFMQIGVDPPELLHEVVLREAADAYEIKGGFLLRKGIGDVADYVSKCLVSDDSVIIELKSVAKRLPYVEESYVEDLLKKDRRRFISNAKAKGEYVVLEKIEFDNAEVEGGRKLCESCVKNDGHFSLKELVLDDSAEMNGSRLSKLALRKAFYHRFLEDRFSVKNDRVQMRTHEKRAK